MNENFCAWWAQTDFDFGFVPLCDNCIVCPIEASIYVKQSGKPNFLGCRVPLKSLLPCGKNCLVVIGTSNLSTSWSLVFPLIKRGLNLRCDYKNYSSTTDNPKDVEAYLTEELQHGAIVVPFSEVPIPNCHLSPFYDKGEKRFTELKSHSRSIIAKRRIC